MGAAGRGYRGVEVCDVDVVTETEEGGVALYPTERLVRRAYEAQAVKDVDGYLELLSEDFVMHIPGRSRIAGDYVGRDAMRRHFQEIATLSGGTFTTEIHDVLGSEDHGIGLVQATGERDGVTVALPRVHAWHSRGGRLTELWLHPSDPEAFDAYWGT